MTGGGKFGFAGYAASQTSAAPPVTPPGPIVIYGDISAPSVPDPATVNCCAMDSTQFSGWQTSIGVTDNIGGAGVEGVAYNQFGDSAYFVPPGSPTTATFVAGLANVPASQRTIYEIDAATYAGEWFNYGPPGSWEDVYNIGGYADNGGGAATSWSWTTVITTQALSNGCVATLGGSSSTTQDSTFQSVGGNGVGQYIVMIAGRGGYPAAGDRLIFDTTVTATNAGGSAQASWNCRIDWV